MSSAAAGANTLLVVVVLHTLLVTHQPHVAPPNALLHVPQFVPENAAHGSAAHVAPLRARYGPDGHVGCPLAGALNAVLATVHSPVWSQ